MKKQPDEWKHEERLKKKLRRRRNFGERRRPLPRAVAPLQHIAHDSHVAAEERGPRCNMFADHMDATVKQFEMRIREYLDGKVSRDAVHQLALDLEYEGAKFAPEEYPLEELQLIFLIDSADDPQFRVADAEVARLLRQLERLAAEVKQFGRERVRERIAREQMRTRSEE